MTDADLNLRSDKPASISPQIKSGCWLCGGTKRVEWSGVDADGNYEKGVYDPCPECCEVDSIATPVDGS